KQKSISNSDLVILKKSIHDFIYDVLGFRISNSSKKNAISEKNKEILDLLLEVRNKARAKKDFEISDFIRESLTKLKIELNDTENGTNYELK
ncbi:MAG: cysteine--tRNA ligase, partial [Flavobacteriaceae bacterium]